MVPRTVDVGGKEVHTLDAGNTHAVVALSSCAVHFDVGPVWNNPTLPCGPTTSTGMRTLVEKDEEVALPAEFEDKKHLVSMME